MNPEQTEQTKYTYSQLPTVVFIDSVARLIIGAVDPAKQTENTLAVISPAVVDIVAGAAPGTFGIRIVPLILTELLENGEERPTVFYDRRTITESDAVLQQGIVTNYRKTLEPPSKLITPEAPGAIVTPDAISKKALF